MAERATHPLRVNWAGYPIPAPVKDGLVTSPPVKDGFRSPQTEQDGFNPMLRNGGFDAGNWSP